IDNNKRAQYAGFVAGIGSGLCAWQKNGADEHGQADDGWSVAAPGAERNDYQRRSGNSQENAEEHPRARVAARVQDFWNEQHQGEQSSNGNMTKAFAETLLLGKRGIGSQAIGHDSSEENIPTHQPCRYYEPTLAIVLGDALGQRDFVHVTQGT